MIFQIATLNNQMVINKNGVGKTSNTETYDQTGGDVATNDGDNWWPF
jgi:hypothetical protein